jgi:hypothetical protein
MTPVERASLKNESVIGTVSQNLLEGPVAKNLALEHLLERASVARCASRRRYEETTPLVFLNPNSFKDLHDCVGFNNVGRCGGQDSAAAGRVVAVRIRFGV